MGWWEKWRRRRRRRDSQTLEMMIPAIEILTLGPWSSLYRRSTPFQKEMTYRLIAMLSSPCSLNESRIIRFYRLVQLSTSSLAIHEGAIFSAVSGRKLIPISAIEAPEHGAWYRLLGFCLTITFCLIPAHQAVSYWNCHWYWRISRLGDHKYLPFVTNPYEIKQANPLTNTAISKGNGLVCWN